MALTQEERERALQMIRDRSGLSESGSSSRIQEIKRAAQQSRRAPEESVERSTEGVVEKEEDNRTLLQKAAGVSEATFGRAADFLFGTTAKTVGSVIGAGIESAAELAGVETEKPFTKIAQEELGDASAFINIPLTALETFPGGAAVRSALSGTKLAPLADDVARLLGRIPEKLQQSAAEQFARVLGPTTKKLKKAAKRVVPELLDRRVTALTKEGLLERATAERMAAGEAIENALQEIPEAALVKTKATLDALESLKDRFVIKGTEVVANKNAIASIDALKEVIGELGEEASLHSLVDLKRIWDKEVASAGRDFARPLAESTALNLKRAASNALRGELAKESPELARLNAEFALWKSAEEILEATAERVVGQKGFARRITQLAGAVAGGAQGGLIGIFGGATIANNLSKLINSAAWGTISAKTKAQLADALASGNFGIVTQIVNRLIAGIANTTDQD